MGRPVAKKRRPKARKYDKPKKFNANPLEQIIHRMRLGDPDAGFTLAMRLQKYVAWRMRRFPGRHSRSAQDLHDIAGDGWVAAWRAANHWAPGWRSVSLFIRNDVDRAIKDALKITRPMPEPPPPPNIDHEPALTAALALDSASRRLDPMTKKIIRWCLLDPDPIPVGYAAKALGVSKATAERRLAAGSAALAALLTDR